MSMASMRPVLRRRLPRQRAELKAAKDFGAASSEEAAVSSYALRPKRLLAGPGDCPGSVHFKVFWFWGAAGSFRMSSLAAFDASLPCRCTWSARLFI